MAFICIQKRLTWSVYIISILRRKVNLDDVILVPLWLTLCRSTAAVMANQLEPEIYEY